MSAAAPDGPPVLPSPPSAKSGGGGTAVSAAADTGAGVILAVIVWGWLVLPFLTGGPARVKAVLKAKFLNKASDGTWLP